MTLGENENSESLLRIYYMPNHILEYQLSTSENVNVHQVTNFTEKKEKLFFDPHLTPLDNMKIPKSYCTST